MNSESKKSETLEIRISHEGKAALQTKARSDRRTVSDVIRDMISAYLSGEHDVEQTSTMGAVAGRTRNPIRVWAAVISAVLVMCAIAVAFVRPAGYAQELSVQLDGVFMPSREAIHTFGSDVDVDYGKPYDIVIGDDDSFKISLEVQHQQSGGQGVLLAFRIIHKTGGEPVLLAEPIVEVDFDVPARVEFTDPDGGFYGFTARAISG